MTELVDTPVVILDKSYLYGASQSQIRELCGANRVMWTPGLMYELLKEKEPDRSRCFQKLPPGQTPVTLIDRLGGVLKYEIEKQAPCAPIWDHRLPLVYEFNDRLAAGDYEGPTELWETMKEERTEIEDMAAGFVLCTSFIPGWCPALREYKAGAPSGVIDELQEEIASDPDTVRRMYVETHDNRFPPVDAIGPDWAHYRRLQVWLIAGLEFIRRYGVDDFESVPRWAKSTYVDLQYAVFGVLAGNFATRDKLLIRMFSLIRPDGNLIT